jgi:hypothetical protein
MKSIRRFTYAVVWFISALNFAPSLASAQEAGGTFTLAHEVHWQNVVVPAGKYHFTVEPDGPSELLTLTKVTGGAGFMMLVTEVDSSEPKDMSHLELVSRPGGKFVSTMQLPEFGVTLHFTVPAEKRELAQSAATLGATQTASATR